MITHCDGLVTASCWGHCCCQQSRVGGEGWRCRGPQRTLGEGNTAWGRHSSLVVKAAGLSPWQGDEGAHEQPARASALLCST